MLPSIIGIGLKAAGAIAGGIRQRAATREIEGRIDQADQRYDDVFNRSFNERATERADARRLLTMAEDSFRAGTRRAAGAAAVGGATEESVAASKAAAVQGIAGATGQIEANAAARGDQLRQQYLANKAQIDEARNNISRQKAAATGQAVQGVFDAAGNLMSI